MSEHSGTAASWVDRTRGLGEVAQRQLFFIGGAPRSGTTWVQEMLDHHPDISCRAEALLHQDLARPLDALMAAWAAAITAKNATTFRHAKGYPAPTQDDADMLLGTAVLLALQRQSAGCSCHAIGEKTPENVFLFPRLKPLFPAAKFIGVARDPRDTLSSAWHFWAKANLAQSGHKAMAAFVDASLPAIEEGLQSLFVYAAEIPQDCRIVTYEQLTERPAPIAAGLCRFLGVSDEPDLVDRCVRGAAFSNVTGGRPRGQTQEGAFHRKGVVGDWAATFPADIASRIVARLDWAYDWFGWRR